MSTVAAALTASILILSIGLYFGVILALFGLLVLAGSVGQWNLARTWFPAFFEHAGITFVLVAITLRMHDLALLGLSLIAVGRFHGARDAARLNPKIESTLLTFALISVGVLALAYTLG